MTEEIPLIPKVNALEVRTGNIVNWNRLKRKPNINPTEELSECITATVQKFLAASDKTELQYVTHIDCLDNDLHEPLQEEERGELKVTIKVFLCSKLPPQVIHESVEKVMEDLKVSFVETVLLSISMFNTEEEITVEQLKPYWKVLEKMVQEEKVLSIGVSDLDKTKLAELYEWAKVKPSTDQVNLASCCVMPKELTEYAKLVDVQLLTHNDPTELLPASKLQEAIRMCSTEPDSVGWVGQWVARYSVLVKCRGIIKSKGYVLSASRDLHQRA
ncbi:hypothetical protein C0Q70_18329 [Pomacea canaliculata]|uniref:GCS light chain n=2 Tax=Pomacea canaliculata TaxID=400727 RepID=A0A2T7NMX2_POMCA|nr:hypothetical protein C0Q70_18329 [Pomacea canaliculata]